MALFEWLTKEWREIPIVVAELLFRSYYYFEPQCLAVLSVSIFVNFTEKEQNKRSNILLRVQIVGNFHSAISV